MTTLKIYGYSDDLVEVEGDAIEKPDEFPAATISGSSGAQVAGTLRVVCGGDSADVHAIYGPDGAWCFAVQASECHNIIPWPVERSEKKDCTYSETVTFTLPGPATIRWIAP